jgi:hypothetical protein
LAPIYFPPFLLFGIGPFAPPFSAFPPFIIIVVCFFGSGGKWGMAKGK